MTFAELKTEFFARGTDYLNEDAAGVTRAENWLNQAYREILNRHVWPFTIATQTGSAGAGTVAVTDLRKVLLVADTTSGTTPGRPLRKATYDELVRDDEVDLNQTGSPAFYWIDQGATIRAWPVGGTIFVRYTKRVAPLTGTGTPIFAEEYHNLIIQRAMMLAYLDTDNFGAWAALKQEFEQALAMMAADYQLDTREVSYIQMRTPYDG